MSVSWVYRLSKQQLQEELRRHQIDAEGSLALLRQRLVCYVRTNPELFNEKPEDPTDYKEEADRSRDIELMDQELQQLRQRLASSTPQQDVVINVTPEPETRSDNTKILDQMRKWNCHFDGKNLYSFLERVQELQRAYLISDAQLIRGLPELLKGDALLWYRNCASEIFTWEELELNLRKYFLSPRELRHLDQQIYDRRQGPVEPIRPYVTSLLTLMRRRGNFRPERVVVTLYYNMRPNLRLFIRRTEIDSPNDLIQRVEEIEEVQGQLYQDSRTENKTNIRPKKQPTSTIQPAYDRFQCCWRCKQRGHDRFSCNNRARKFCSWCGKDDIFSKNCHCERPGNGQRAGSKTGRPRPSETSNKAKPGPSSEQQ